MALFAAFLLSTSVGAMLVDASGASAAPASNVTAVSVASATADLGGYTITGDAPTLPPTSFDLNVTATATWTGSLTTNLGWDSSDVRQGATLDVSRVAPLTSGNIDVEWSVSGTINPLGFGDTGVGPLTLSASSVSCSPTLSGGDYSCSATSGSVHLIQTPGIPLSPYVDAAIQVNFTVTPTGAIVGRTFSIGGKSAVPPANLPLTDSPQTDALPVSCTSAPGDDVSYALAPYDWTPTVAASQQPVIQVGLMDPIFGVAELPALFSAPFGSAVNTNPTFDLNSTTGDTVDLGSLLPNNVSPTIAPFGTFTGSEGSPVSFSASTTSQCPITSYVWQFSDGTTSYGPTPLRTFNDGGVYNGQLTVTDDTGLSATQNFTVDVANVAPSVNAGPDTTVAWGQPVALNGQATAGGSDDQSTLQYTWTFGDGSPSASGGPDVVHAYAVPGVYTATLQVCDEDGLCSSSNTQITVTKRATTTGYTGNVSGTFNTPATLGASLVDQFGNPVNGASIQFQVGSDGPFTAVTGSDGNSSMSYSPTLAAGTYNASATFAGNALYGPSSSPTNSFSVARKATTTTYTGAVSGKPNKVIALTAVVKDATGTPLPGKTVTFTVGSQTTSAVTDTNGVAATTLALNQHNGSYTVSATYAGDPSFYVGSSNAAVFSLQTK